MIFRNLTVLVIILLGAFAYWQHGELSQLQEIVYDQEERLAELEIGQSKREAVTDLFYKFIVSNRKDILDLRRSRTVTVTAYSPRASETDSTPTITASNRKVRNGIIAVSRDLFDAGWVFGKKVYIKGLGIFVIEDLMAARKRNQIDVFMDDPTAAISFGRKQLSAHLIDS